MTTNDHADQRNGHAPDAALGRIADQARERARPSVDPRARADAAGVELGEVTELRGRLLEALRTYLYLPDPAHVLVLLAAAATAVEPDDVKPTWVYVVAPSSLAKTETTALLARVQAGQLSDITPAGLLSWSKSSKKQGVRPVGLLAGITHGVVVFPDLSPLLAGAQRGGKDAVFAMLRDIYDGALFRTVQAPGGGTDAQLSWRGRLTVIGAVTVEIDRQLAFVQALGERSLYVRVTDPTRADQRAAARMARQAPPGTAEKAAELASALVWSAQARLCEHGVTVSEPIHQAVEDAALVCAHGRANVPRNTYGAQEITGPAEIEGVGRLVKQLTGLSRGLLALGLGEPEVIALVRRVALDSMPARRLRVLRVLAMHPQGPPEETGDVDLSDMEAESTLGRDIGAPAPVRRWGAGESGWLVSPLGRAAGMDRKAARRVLEEFAAIGLACAGGDDVALPEGVVDAHRRWVLAEDFVADIAEVFGPAVGVAAGGSQRPDSAGSDGRSA